MEAADEGDVIYLGDEHGTISSGVDTENDQYGVEDAGPDTSTEDFTDDAQFEVNAELGTEDDGDNGEFEVQDEDDGGGGDGKSDEKKDDNMLVVDELDNADQQATSDQGLIYACSHFSVVKVA